MFTKRNEFVYDLVENYYLNNLSSNQFWLFGADIDNNQPLSNTEQSGRAFLESTIFGIKYGALDYAFMIQNNMWADGVVYNEFDDTKDNENFYVIVEPDSQSGSYRVFKCISNNAGSPSLVKPEFSPLIQDGLYELSDGYVWKFVTSTPFTLFKKFAAKNLFPITRNQEVENIAVDGIFKINVENPTSNIGYEKISGFVSSTDVGNGRVVVFLKKVINETRNRTLSFQITNEYANRSIFIQKISPNDQIGAISKVILESGVAGGLPYVVVQEDPNFIIDEDDVFQILPTIEIDGDGNSAIAIPEFDDLRIISIRILNPGKKYTIAAARIRPPERFDPTNVNRNDIECILRPIISPKGGHGSNAIFELKSRHIALSKLVSNISFSGVPSSGFYNSIGLVKSPVLLNTNLLSFDNRIKMILDVDPQVSISSFLAVGDIISQRLVNGVVVSGTVHEIDESTYTKTLSVTAGSNSDTLQVTSPAGIKPGQIVQPRTGIGSGVTVVSIIGNSILLSSPISQSINEGETVTFLTKEIYVSKYSGFYNETFSLPGSITVDDVINININTIEFSQYQQKSGAVLTTTFLDKVERKSDRTEQTKIIIEF